MYTPAHFKNDDIDSCFALMCANSFATVVSHIDGELEATHAPVLVTRDSSDAITLTFHLAAANPICADLDAGKRALVIFSGTHGYISPHWYTSPDMVPTWNYTAVHAAGLPQLLDDDELVELLETLSATNEQTLDKQPWSPAAIDQAVYARQRRLIKGYRIPVDNMIGKAKLNQNRTVDDRQGAINALQQLPDNAGTTLAKVMQRSLDND